MTTTTKTHYTAWINTDTHFCADDPYDVAVFEDTPVSYYTNRDGHKQPIWGCVGIPLYQHDTTTPGLWGEVENAIAEATDLLEVAGWRIVEPWQLTDIAWIATVERNDKTTHAQADLTASQGNHQCLT